MSYETPKGPKLMLIGALAAIVIVAAFFAGKWQRSGAFFSSGGITIATGGEGSDLRAANAQRNADRKLALDAEREANRASLRSRVDAVAKSFDASFEVLSEADVNRAKYFMTVQGGRSLADSLDGTRTCISSDRRFLLIESGGYGQLFFRFGGLLRPALWSADSNTQDVDLVYVVTLNDVSFQRLSISGLRGSETAIAPVFTSTVQIGTGDETRLSFAMAPGATCTQQT